MKRKKKHYRKPQSHQKAGEPPGKLVYIGDEKTAAVKVHVMDYGNGTFTEEVYSDPKQCFRFRDTPTHTWINITGIHKPEIVEQVGKHFGISVLALEDVLNTNSRPKVEEEKDYLFLLLKMIDFDDEKQALSVEQVSLFLGKNFILSFQENEPDLFDKLRERLRTDRSRIRQWGADFLLYSIMDKVVDNYFVLIEKTGDLLEALEDEVAGQPGRDFVNRLNELKRNNIVLRKSVWPLREVINVLLRGESVYIKPETQPYFRDLYDHTIQVIDSIETFRDLLGDMMDTYLSSISLRLNEVMKVLTVISTIFIPLTFVAGVYGMNFDFMPELRWRFGYYGILIIMALIGGGMVVYFKKKRWF